MLRGAERRGKTWRLALEIALEVYQAEADAVFGMDIRHTAGLGEAELFMQGDRAFVGIDDIGDHRLHVGVVGGDDDVGWRRGGEEGPRTDADGAPHIERLRHNPGLAAALGAITAAVVGVILNLALWFGWHFVMPGGRLDPWAAALSGVALVLVFGLRWGVVPVLALCAAAGMALRLAGVA